MTSPLMSLGQDDVCNKNSSGTIYIHLFVNKQVLHVYGKIHDQRQTHSE